MDPNRLLILACWVAAGTALSGCGEQDLYKPPESPYEKAGQVAMRSDIEDVAVLGNYAYVAAGQAGLKVVDLTDPFHPVILDSLWVDTPKYAEAIEVARTYDPDGSPRDIAFIIEGTEGMLTYDVTAVPDSIHDFEQGAGAYDGTGHCVALAEFTTDPYRVYLADSWKAVRIFESDPEFPGTITAAPGWVATYGYTKNLDVSGDTLYVAEDEMGLTVIHVRHTFGGGQDIIANLDTPGNALDVALDRGYAFVADGKSGLHVMKLTEEDGLVMVSSLPLTGECRAIEVSKNLAFLAAEDAGLHIVDVRDPHHPKHLGNVVTSHALGVSVGRDNLVCIADRDDGLVVFLAPELPGDFTPPATVTDLGTHLLDTSTVELSWIAPGDDDHTGTAAEYDIRYSLSPIADSTWDAAEPLVRRPVPKEAGRRQTAVFEGLFPGETYSFALKTADKTGNWSEISNLATALMTSPTLSYGSVDPEFGSPTTLFTYEITYQDAENDSPMVHNVIIDGETFEMEEVGEGGGYVDGALFRYQTRFDYGSHEYRFEFDDGHGPLLVTSSSLGPDVPAGDPFDFVMIPVNVAGGAEFTMGSPAGERGREDDETEHAVTLTRNFAIGETEVNQYLYVTVMNANPSYFRSSERPVEQVTWYDAVKFCNALSGLEELDPAYEITGESHDAQGRISSAIVSWVPEANGYRLPTEAEWEYTCRGGTTTALCNGDLTVEAGCDSLDAALDAVGWYCGNSDAGTGFPKTRDARSKEPNGIGLYDMHGNVWEWCWDAYGAYPSAPVTDPTGPADMPGDVRVRRGGSWFYFARDCRSASRGSFYPGSADNTVGFRVARNGE